MEEVKIKLDIKILIRGNDLKNIFRNSLIWMKRFLGKIERCILVGFDSRIVLFSGDRFRVNLEILVCFKWIYVAFVNNIFVCLL